MLELKQRTLGEVIKPATSFRYHTSTVLWLLRAVCFTAARFNPHFGGFAFTVVGQRSSRQTQTSTEGYLMYGARDLH